MTLLHDPIQGIGHILIVDDQVENLELLEEILSVGNFTVERAINGEEALQAVNRRVPDCVILDIMMPGIDGFEVCKRLKGKRLTYYIPVIMLTALSEISDKVKGLEVGADDFLNKPVNAVELLARVGTLVRIKQIRDELDTSENIIFSMIQALEMKDPASVGHSERVATYSIRMGRKRELPSAELDTIAKAAILHDIGKIGLPETILSVGDTLSWEQKRKFETHAEVGAEILAPLLSFGDVRELILHHHERLDGSGYPHGLTGEMITLPAEIVALANEFDDLVTRYSKSEAIERIQQQGHDGLFHQDLVQLLVEVVSGEDITADELDEAWVNILPVPKEMPGGKILVGDDTPSNREVIEEILTNVGHTVLCVENGLKALEVMETFSPDLVILDIRMPGMDGFEVCQRIKTKPETELLPVILVTALREITDRLKGMEAGADDFLLLPLNRLEVTARVQSLLRQRYYLIDLEQHQNVILSLASALEAKDAYTRGHSDRVSSLAVELAVFLGLSDIEQDILSMAGKLHDIGKIGVSELLLNKPGKLTGEEFAAIMEHPARGQKICQRLRTVRSILPIIRHHHERFDGSGYPDHLQGEKIPYLARMLGIVDAYDAMVSERPYREALKSIDAILTLEEETNNGKWDPRLFRALRDMLAMREPG